MRRPLFFTLVFSVVFSCIRAQDRPYSVPPKPWNDSLGNHRAVLRVLSRADAVLADIPWRRRDHHPGQKAVLVTDSTGNEIRDVYCLFLDRESGKLIFNPSAGPGTYYVYYLPYRGKKQAGYYEGEYLSKSPGPDPDWMAKNNAHWDQLPGAAVVGFQSRTDFDSFFPMEVIATHKETDSLIGEHPGDLMLFPEDRKYPIRMFGDLPLKWIRSGPSSSFSGVADRNEYYVFQVGMFAPNKVLTHVRVKYNGADFPLTCFNLEGSDSRGKYFTKRVDVDKGKIQPLWFGVDIPDSARTGNHRFTVTIYADECAPMKVRVTLLVKDSSLADRGDAAAWRYSRLRWLNSSLGLDHTVTAPYKSLRVNGHTITASSATIKLNEFGLPEAITRKGINLLKAPLSFFGDSARLVKPLRYTRQEPGMVSWVSEAAYRGLCIRYTGTMEFDGYLHYQVRIIPTGTLPVSMKDIQLRLSVQKNQARYFMGMGLPGMECPTTYDWKWHGPQDAYWIGNTDIGLYCKMLGAVYSGPMLNLYHPPPPPPWYNDNKGGFRISSNGDTVNCISYVGDRQFLNRDTCLFEWSFLVTPVKDLDTKAQFTDRYYHNGEFPSPRAEDLSSGIKVINVHQGNPTNPYINYPFLSADSIRDFVQRWHGHGMKVKLYYTIRELSNQAEEIWALRSLGTEVLAGGKGGGYPWLREHLDTNYNPQWFTPIVGYEACDAAVLTSGDSRWYNYYIEGLRWLIRNTGVDGVYLDDVAFDRSMLQRMRRVMDKEKPGCLIDLHSNTYFSIGPATQYTEYFPYINKLWFGEHFWYNKMPPANWLVEVSGIPFGLMGDMLQSGGNPWRGMVYGMTVRYPWLSASVLGDPRPIWKIWDGFGIADARMKGYWGRDSVIRTSDTAVLATAYIRPGKVLVALASWAKDTVKIRLDLSRLGLQPTGLLTAPAIEGFQPAAVFSPTDSIEVAPGKGWLLSFHYL